jgi:diguanylate cyclase (GGDEF)-like protein
VNIVSLLDSKTNKPKNLYLSEAKEQGFVQFLQTISVTFYAIPIGWLLIFGLVHQKVPLFPLLLWIAVFYLYWVFSVLAFNKFKDEGPSLSKHFKPVCILLILEGILWGAMFYVTMGYDVKTDTWTAIFFVGIISVILPTYITYPKGFHLVLLGTIISSPIALLLIANRLEPHVDTIIALLMYLTAIGFLVRPISARVVEAIRLELVNTALTAQLQESLEALSHQANTDALTGQLNRHALNKALSDLIIKGERRKRVFTLLMMDIDFFKAINDNHGHDVGDKALMHVAGRITAQLREGDLCARFGGEEFVVLLPSTDTVEAMRVAERIREAVESSPLELPKQPITLSIGVATYQPGMTAEMLLKAADKEVYRAKENGRNQVRLSTIKIASCAN